MKEIDKILSKIEQHILQNTYECLETDRFELKDLSNSGEWTELHKTICAFLNTKGGIAIIGIKEDTKNKCFKFTGFNSGNEEKLKQIPFQFTDENHNQLQLNDFINPSIAELKPFLDGQVCVVFVEKLPEEQKYVFYKNEAFERQLTGDHRITKDKIQRQNELKEELRNATELELVPNTTIDDLDIERLNEFIFRLNTDKKVETIKADIPSAISFLTRKKMVRENSPTLLGMLVCGNDIFDHLGSKCELDAYFETGSELASDQKVYKDNIIPLMESAWNFTFSKIGVGISVHKGGSPVYEYPEDIIRETINNALAHRDYKTSRFSILRVVNNEFIEIRNPGKFRKEQLLYADEPVKIRRIIPIPKAHNPNLADILKIYKRWEGRGIGMSTLTNYALNNEIDVPYYRLYSENEIGLYIPKGKVLDNKLQTWLKSFDKYILRKTGGIELTEEEKTVLAYFYKSENLNSEEKFTVNLTPDNNHFLVINNLINYGLVEKLPQSTLEIQVFKIDNTLKKNEFTKELREVFGNSYDALSSSLKDVLQSIYQHNEFSLISEVSANVVGNHLYYKRNNSVNFNLNEYNNFKRKVRNDINKLEKSGLIIRKIEGKPSYNINRNFHRTPSIFD